MTVTEAYCTLLKIGGKLFDSDPCEYSTHGLPPSIFYFSPSSRSQSHHNPSPFQHHTRQQPVSLPGPSLPPPGQNTRETMGSFCSRPGKPKIRVLAPTKRKLRNSYALRRRISMNKETLDRFLQRTGHPVRERSRISTHQKRRCSRRPSTLRKSTLSRRKTPNRPSPVSATSSSEVDTNLKPLPPLPLLVTKPQQNEPQLQSKRHLPKQQQSQNQPPSQLHPRPLPPTPSDCPPGILRFEAQLEREYIERQREKTLRRLEARKSRNPKTLQQLESKKSRVPDIIFRRIQEGSSMLLGNFDSRATRRKRRCSGLAWDRELFGAHDSMFVGKGGGSC